jgi:tRNA U34 5-carboxymethylaminomethyl modifying enzyme MnmG/GidA
VPTEIWELAEMDFRYEGYAARQSEHNRQLNEGRITVIPDGLDFNKIAGLVLRHGRNCNAASNVAGLPPDKRITPADIAIISIWLVKNSLQDITLP